MLQTHDWIVPHSGEIRNDKPVLIYWLQSLFMRWAGPGEFPARAPSSFAGALTVVLLFLSTLEMDGTIAGAAITESAPCQRSARCDCQGFKERPCGPNLHGRRRDGCLLVSASGAFPGFAMSFSGRCSPFSALTKGPVGPMVALARGSAYDRGWSRGFSGKTRSSRFTAARFTTGCRRRSVNRWVRRPALQKRRLTGIGLFLLAGLPWAIAVTLRPVWRLHQVHDR